MDVLDRLDISSTMESRITLKAIVKHHTIPKHSLMDCLEIARAGHLDGMEEMHLWVNHILLHLKTMTMMKPLRMVLDIQTMELNMVPDQEVDLPARNRAYTDPRHSGPQTAMAPPTKDEAEQETPTTR